MNKLRRCIGVLAVALACTACGDARQGETLRFWAMGREAETVLALLPEFERRHPDIHVEVQQLPWTAAHEKLLTAIAGDATPDIAQIGNTWLPEMVELGALQPLDALLATSRDISAADYFAGVWQTNQINGQLYGVPWYVDTRLLFYRKDLLKQAGFDAPPRDWQEWLAQLRAIKKLVGPRRYAVLLPLNEFEPLQVLALQQPDAMLRDGGRYGDFHSESFLKALNFYQQLFREQLAPKVSNTQISNVWLELGRGFYSFYISGPWNIGEFKRRLPPEQQDDWMTAPMPGPDGPGVSNAGGSSFAVFTRSRHAKAAWMLIEFLSRPEIQQRFYGITGDLPPRLSAWQDPALAQDPYLKAFADQLTRLRPFPQVPEWERIMEEMRLMAERVALSDESTDQATRELDDRTDTLLAKRRWMLARRTP
ncbi:MAG: sugar ABC transporter substrate-binding protein [Steroidobacteraceae bacterium]